MIAILMFPIIFTPFSVDTFVLAIVVTRDTVSLSKKSAVAYCNFENRHSGQKHLLRQATSTSNSPQHCFALLSIAIASGANNPAIKTRELLCEPLIGQCHLESCACLRTFTPPFISRLGGWGGESGRQHDAKCNPHGHFIPVVDAPIWLGCHRFPVPSMIKTRH